MRTKVSSLGHACQAHAFHHARALGEIGRIVTLVAGAKPAKRELRVDGEAGLYLPARLVDPAEMRETGGEQEERQGSVAVGIDRFSRSQAEASANSPRSVFAEPATRNHSKIIASRGLRRKASST